MVGLNSHWGGLVVALPPKQDIPEEILRMEIITAARSPIDGSLVSAAEYAQLQTRLSVNPPPKLDPKIREQVFLLRIRRFLLQIFPFLDI
ncbi:glutathione S-transferase [Scytonema sp. UIC 10036]|uniref:glutathione S-transferase n=1 Tax=Scytonema sp. UIC 10036 TaxID=2304196 RepID=UPI0012DA609B|nr:glutathione S-transferase [Scytonema sp. UIC 10036]MUH01732.1 glutathione S-transferase [Scytonema sp. UIC 10036]